LARILVLDGHSSAALAFVRSAGRAGHWVAVGAHDGVFSAAPLSRYCNLRFVHPLATSDAQRFVDAVLDFVRQNSIELVVPITDWTLQPLSEQRARFEGVCRVALPPAAAVEAASDKYRTVQIAQRLGIAVPPTSLVKSSSDLENLPEMAFPVVVKDRFSVRWSDGKATFGSVSYAFGKPELEQKIGERLRVAGEILIQGFVSGAGLGFACFVAKDEVMLPFEWKRIREVDPKGSASSCRESIPLDEHLVHLSGELIREIGFQGIAMVEYKRTGNGDLVLMEINGRPWGSIALPIASGIDYPRYLIDWWLTGALPPKSIAYRGRITCRRLVGELNHLRNVRKGKPAHWPGDYPRFWSSLARVAIPWYPGMHYDELWLSDWRPGVAEIGNWVRARLK
jgi:predicted ATP-grasp superfamily ATP-dependent carboligase